MTNGSSDRAPARCAQCGGAVGAAANFCPQCGAKVRRRPASRAERRQVTVVFCDLVGSTALSEQLDPEEFRDLICLYQEACGAVVEHFAGYVAQYLGDGILIYFGYPKAHEDDVQRAVHAALEIVAAMGPLNQRLALGRRVPPLAVRVGIHTGPVVAGDVGVAGHRQEQLALGSTPNVAARLQGLAEPNSVVVSAECHRLVADFFTWQPLGRRELKGTQPMEAFRALAPSGVRNRFEVTVTRGLRPLVGRTEEIETLAECHRRAQAGQGQAVLLSGESGIGKSRILHAFVERLEPGCRSQIGYCSAYAQGTALASVIPCLKRLLKIAEDDSGDDGLAKLEQRLERLQKPGPEPLTLLAGLLEIPCDGRLPPLQLDPELQRRRALETAAAVFTGEAALAPLVLVIEDLHWIDPSTAELLDLLLAAVRSSHLLLVLSCRPSFVPSWLSPEAVVRLELDRLETGYTRTVVENMSGDRALPEQLVHEIVSRADGIPLFAEELTRTLIESGALYAGEDRYELTGAWHELAIPDTLHGSLMARLDGLKQAKETAQLAAVIGREFSYELLSEISELDEPTLRRHLEELLASELLVRTAVVPRETYNFRHALLQDTAYESLLKSVRRHHHRRIADAVVARFPTIAEREPEFVAQHFTAAGLVEPAADYWRRAARKAVDRYAFQEAMKHVSRGLEALAALPDPARRWDWELDLQLAQGAALIATRGYTVPEVEQAYTRALELCERSGESRTEIFWVLWGLGATYQAQAELARALEMARRHMDLARVSDQPYLFVDASFGMGSTRFLLGDFAEARRHFTEAAKIYGTLPNPSENPTGHHAGVMSSMYNFVLSWYLGHPDRARQEIRYASALAERLAHPYSTASVLAWSAWLHQLSGRQRETRESAEAAGKVANDFGLSLPADLASLWTAWASISEQEPEEGLAHFRQTLEAYRESGCRFLLTYFLGLYAEALLAADRPAEALAVVEEALEQVERSGERFSEADLHRLEGEARLALEPLATEPAARCFDRALEVARRQGARSLELRAALSAARLMADRGGRGRAHELLATVLQGFEEGAETRDHIQATSLLAELEDSSAVISGALLSQMANRSHDPR